MSPSDPQIPALYRVPAHRRPFVLAMMLPLATACLLAGPASGAVRAPQIGDLMARQDVTVLTERQRRSETPTAQQRHDDPPASVHTTSGPGAHSRALAEETAEARYADLPSLTIVFPAADDSLPAAFTASPSAPRGPPAGCHR